MSDYRATIGLEVHAELKTRTKMFCGCLNDPDEKEPNKNICPVCMAHPGSLPVINKEAVHKVLLVGAALDSELSEYTEFDRKNYFYPDIPKGYQISQYKYPLVAGGSLRGVELTRIHLEEDTARSQHEANESLVDYNRAGVPLMELVTEPVIHDAETAGNFARELQLLLRSLGAGDANLEKGEMRVEANISVSPSGALGTKVEVKNLNSFRSVERAIAYEIQRQTELVKKGIEIAQETRGWDEQKQATFSQRKKESSHDYRYFPDPDLPKSLPSEVEEFSLERLKKELPELPWNKRARYTALGLKPEDAEILLGDSFLTELFEEVLRAAQEDTELIRLAANYLTSDMQGLRNKSEVVASSPTVTPWTFLQLMRMVQSEALSSRGAKDVLAEMYAQGGEPEVIAKGKKLMQQSDTEALAAIAHKVIDAHPNVVADYKAGKEAALQFLVGQGMKASKGSANPQFLSAAIQKILA